MREIIHSANSTKVMKMKEKTISVSPSHPSTMSESQPNQSTSIIPNSVTTNHLGDFSHSTSIFIAGIQYQIHTTQIVIQRLMNAWDACWFMHETQQFHRAQSFCPPTLWIDDQQKVRQVWHLFLYSCPNPITFFEHDPHAFPIKHVDYQRDDLILSFDPQQQHAWAIIDEYLGSIEACIQIILQYSIRQQQGMLIHASAAYAQGETWLMPGMSGTGKSTAARLGGFELVLSDEMVVVTPYTNHKYMVWGTPFWSQWSIESATSTHSWPQQTLALPLDFIAFLVQDPLPYAYQVSCHPAEAVRHLMTSITEYEQDLTAQSNLFDLACQLIDSVPHAYIHFPKENWRPSFQRTI